MRSWTSVSFLTARPYPTAYLPTLPCHFTTSIPTHLRAYSCTLTYPSRDEASLPWCLVGFHATFSAATTLLFVASNKPTTTTTCFLSLKVPFPNGLYLVQEDTNMSWKANLIRDSRSFFPSWCLSSWRNC